MVSLDSKNTIRSWHLQDQIPIMRPCHKPVQSWSTQDGVEGEADLRDVEQDALRAEVLGRPESNQEGDTTVRHHRHRTHSREWV
jgi:hypothetical protein